MTRPKLLIVDDETGVREAVERILRHEFTVLKAANGEEGLEVLAQNLDCAILLSDHRMPGMSGLQFLSRAHSVAPQAVRAIVSGQIDLQSLADAINSAQIDRLILKPWDNAYLRVQMLEALRGFELRQEKNALEKLAITDPVTHLYNHRFFQDQLRVELERAVRHNRPMSLIMIDVDNFKSFNDQFGHPAGDHLLAAIAKRMQEQVRSIDIVARYGGEEFSILLPDTDISSAVAVAERVRASILNQPFTGPFERPAFVTVSLGVACHPPHGPQAPDLVQAADRALYQAKRQGRNQTVAASI